MFWFVAGLFFTCSIFTMFCFWFSNYSGHEKVTITIDDDDDIDNGGNSLAPKKLTKRLKQQRSVPAKKKQDRCFNVNQSQQTTQKLEFFNHGRIRVCKIQIHSKQNVTFNQRKRELETSWSLVITIHSSIGSPNVMQYVRKPYTNVSCYIAACFHTLVIL